MKESTHIESPAIHLALNDIVLAGALAASAVR